MTNETNITITETETTYFTNQLSGEVMKITDVALKLENPIIIKANTLPAILEDLKKIEIYEVDLTNYRYAKRQMRGLNKLKQAITDEIKIQIEDPEIALKLIKEQAKEIKSLLTEKYNALKIATEQVFGKKVKEICFNLMKTEIEDFYNTNSLENEYRIIEEQDIKNLCEVSRVGFTMLPEDPIFNFECGYLTGEAKKKLQSLTNNCLQFKQERINRIQALTIANLQDGLEENFQVTLEDIKPFLDEVEPNFSNKLKAKIQQATTKQEAIKLENERKLNAGKERLKREAEAEANKQLQLAKEKHEAELKSMKIEVAEAVTKIKEIEQENETLYQKIETLLPRVDKMAHYKLAKTAEIPTHNPEVVKKPVKKYIMLCSKEISVSEDEMKKVRKLWESQGFRCEIYTN